MRQDVVVVGVILIVVGAILFFMGESIYNPFTKSNTGAIFMFFGLISLLAGLVVSILGTVASKTISTNIKSQPVVIPQPIQPPSSQQVKIPEQSLHDEALNILRTRYAKGEITKEQFLQMKKDLEK